MKKNEYMEKYNAIYNSYEKYPAVQRAMRNHSRARVLEGTGSVLLDNVLINSTFRFYFLLGDLDFYTRLLNRYLTPKEHALVCAEDYRKL